MLLQFSLFFVGTWFGYRTFERIFAESDEMKSRMTKIGTLVFVFLLLQLFFSLKVAVTFLFSATLLLLSHFMSKKLSLWRSRRRFRKEFPAILNEIIVRMSGGSSFRQAFLKTIDGIQGSSRLFWREIVEVVTFSQQISVSFPCSLKNSVLQEFTKVHREPHRSLQRLKNYRHRYQLMEDFRRRSGVLTQQARSQAAIIAVLYLGLLLFVVTQFDWQRNFLVIAASAAVFIIGSLWTWQIGRSWRWKL